ncbi:hypothetical protein ACFWWM_33190 [Streptomyces sp. NPDC058682]|uniref:hypothetical protein n=1 Tax=Streptomyces sp. NPDC058682 TaxID=3346596 RepID=UPI00365B8020
MSGLHEPEHRCPRSPRRRTRRALLDAALAQLEERSLGSLGLREVARHAGVDVALVADPLSAGWGTADVTMLSRLLVDHMFMTASAPYAERTGPPSSRQPATSSA